MVTTIFDFKGFFCFLSEQDWMGKQENHSKLPHKLPLLLSRTNITALTKQAMGIREVHAKKKKNLRNTTRGKN